MKFCTGCQIQQPLDQFYTRKDRNGQRRPSSRCTACVKAKAKAWQRTNSERFKALQKRWRDTDGNGANKTRRYRQRMRDDPEWVEKERARRRIAGKSPEWLERERARWRAKNKVAV